MKVILLNGPSSAGKTSIAKELQKILPELYLLTGLDNVIYMMPESINDYAGDLKPRVGFGWVQEIDEEGHTLSHLTPGKYGKQVYDMLKKQVKFLADNGFNVIVDHVALIPNDYNIWKECLVGCDLFVIGISAAPEILKEREARRGDRVSGISKAQHQLVHKDFIYDMEIDTSHVLPIESAEKIKQFIY